MKKINPVDISTFLLYAWVCTVALVWSPVPCASVWLRITVCFGVYLISRGIFALRVPSGAAVACVFAVLGIGESIYGLLQIAGYAQAGHILYTLTGTFFNPGPYGGFLAMCCVPLLAYYKRTRRSWAFYSFVFIAAMAAASGSRAAMVAIGVCTALIYSDNIMRLSEDTIIIISTCILISLCIMIYFNPDSAVARIFMDYMSIRSIADHPLTGSGLNGYLSALSEQEIAYFSRNPYSYYSNLTGVAEFAFCAPLQAGVELGVPGLLLYTALTVSALLYLHTRKDRCGFHAMLALTIFSLFSYPLALWEFGLAFAVLTAMGAAAGGGSVQKAILLSDSMRKIETETSQRTASLPWAASATSAIAGLVLIAASLWLHTPYRTAEREYRSFAHIKNAAFIKDYYELLPYMGENQNFLFNFGQILREEKRYNDSNDMLRRGAAVSNDPMMRVLMGRNHEDMGEHSEASNMYRAAHYMHPNRLYPMYRLMINKAEDSEIWARKILYTMPKVESTATRQIKLKADSVLYRATHPKIYKAKSAFRYINLMDNLTRDR